MFEGGSIPPARSMPTPSPARSRWPLLPAVTALLVGLAVVVGLSWPLALHLRTWHALTPFGDSHVWVFDWLARVLASGEALTQTSDIGYPRTRVVRLIGWVPALASLPLRPLLGSLGAANVIQLLSLPVSGLVAGVWIRRRTGVDSWSAAALGLAYGLGPTALSTFGIQEISNTQVWVFPAFLMALDAADARPAALPLVFLVSLCASFTSPYFGLALPLIAGAWAGWRVFRPREDASVGVTPPAPTRRLARRILGPALLLAVVAAGMLPARVYYEPLDAAGEPGAFRPARHAEMHDLLPFPPPVARPDSLLLGNDPIPRQPRESHHVAYLGAVLLVAAGVLALLRRPPGGSRRGAAEGATLLVGGALLALGPYLAWSDRLLHMGRARIALPVWLLEAAGYPTRFGGLYFRYTVIAEAGLVLLLGALLAGRRRAPAVAWALLVLHVADGIRASGSLWPRPCEEVPGLADLGEMTGADGAVLELPLQAPTNGMLGQGGMLRAVFHGRPTTSLARDVPSPEAELPVLVSEATRSRLDAVARLRGAGFRYVVLPRDEEAGLSSLDERLVEQLGLPWREGALRIWDLGPTRIAPLPLQTSREGSDRRRGVR
jgi:hypothetical protein